MENWTAGKKVLWKWNSEVYNIERIIGEQVILKNVKDGSITKQPKSELIYIYNL
jgi:hypothetical protein